MATVIVSFFLRFNIIKTVALDMIEHSNKGIGPVHIFFIDMYIYIDIYISNTDIFISI